MQQPVPQANSSFSTLIPSLQLAWDSTSLNALKTCPRLYQYTIVEGYAPRMQSVHLQFGVWMHEGKEHYDRALACGAEHDDAVLQSIRYIMANTWDKERNRPWISDDPNKNRATLVRTLIWYFEHYKDDSITTVKFADGSPAVELSFSFDTSYKSSAGETFLLCGHIDRLGQMNDKTFPCDVKTTKYTLDDKFFAGFAPHNQFTLYSLAARTVYNLPTYGLVVDGCQIAVTFSRFERRTSPRDEAQLNEWYADLGHWLQVAEGYATAGWWPMNEASCGNYGGCPFRRVCSKPPSIRRQWLQSDFVHRVWDPLQVRGDI